MKKWTPLSYDKETMTITNAGRLLQGYKDRHQKQDALTLTVASGTSLHLEFHF